MLDREKRPVGFDLMEPSSTAIAYPELGIELRSYRELTQPFAAHSHDRYVIGHVESGTRDMVCDGRTCRVLPDDLLVFNPGDVHECTQHGEAPLTYTSLAIQPSTVCCRRLDGPIVRDGRAISAFDELTHALEEDADNGETLSLLCKLMSTLSVHKPSDERMPASAKSDGLAEAAERAQGELRTQMATRPSLDELATEQGVSKFQLLRAYKKRYAITPLAHLSSFKVERACELLARGVAPGEVAMELGFADQAHLTRVFKQQIGMTPGAYQHMIVGGAESKR